MDYIIFYILIFFILIVIIYFIIKKLTLISSDKNKNKNKNKNKDKDKDSFIFWKIPLYRFHFMHEPHRDTNQGYMGRNRIRENFLSMLHDGKDKSGTYLIAGYRGSGKTSFVRIVLKYYMYGDKKPPNWLGQANWLKNKFLIIIGYIEIFNHKFYHSIDKEIKNEIYRFTLSMFLFFYKTIIIIIIVIKNKIFKLFDFPFVIYSIVLFLFLSFSPSALEFLKEIDKIIKPNILQIIKESIPSFIYLFSSIFVAMLISLSIRNGIIRGLNIYKIFQRAFYPVIIVNLNLGHQSLDAKTLLFNIASILRTHYIQKMNPVRTILLISLPSLILTIMIISLIKQPIEIIEKHLHQKIFTVYYLEKNDLDFLNITEGKSVFKDLIINEKKDQIDEKLDKMLLNEKDAYAFIQGALSSILKDTKFLSTKATTILSKAKKSSDFIRQKQIRNICNGIEGAKDGGKKLNLWESASTSQLIYCQIDNIYMEISDFLNPVIKSKATKYEKNIFYKRWDNNIKWWVHLITLNQLRYVKPNHNEHPHPTKAIFFIVIFLILFFSIKIFASNFGRRRVLKELNKINHRIIHSTQSENSAGLPWLGTLFMKKTKTAEPLDSRQAEEMLLNALEINLQIPGFMPRADIIFIFDELDKINPKTGANEPAPSQVNEARYRKEEIAVLLGNLKNFITIAPARFLFIGGRDMYDANLAEQVANNNIHGSMFDAIFYIPSFLTDDSDGSEEDISSMVEQYVCRRLIPFSVASYLYYHSHEKKFFSTEYDLWTLNIYLLYLEEIHGKNSSKIAELYNFLGDFIYYLTYRSSGCVQRLAYHFEHFIETDKKDTNSEYLDVFPNFVYSSNSYLAFNERRQYQVQMIAHIFIILHGEVSPLIRQFGDKLALTTFSLLDYIFKYHDSAFTMQDIERAPDMLDIHRAPTLPQVIDLLLHRVLAPYLKRIDNGLFQYRFLHFFQAEIAYISQFSEQEMAAFNFTLDESLHTKHHFSTLLEQAKCNSPEILSNKKDNFLIKTDVQIGLPFIHQTLGDLYLMDKQFPESSLEYRLALQYMSQAIDEFEIPRQKLDQENSSEKNPYPLKNHVFLVVGYIRLLLKMILTAELRGQYDHAVTLCFQAQRTIEHFMAGYLGRRLFIPNLSIMLLFTQPYICLAFLHVKKNSTFTVVDNIMLHRINKLERLINNAKNKGENKEFTLTEDEKHLLFSKLYTRWAELCLAQSRFYPIPGSTFSARCRYKKALFELEEINPLHFNPSYFSKKGLILSGIANTYAAECSDKEEIKNIKEIDFKLSETKIELNNLSQEKWATYNFPKIYILSYECYKRAARPSDQALSLWQLLFIYIYGFSSSEETYTKISLEVIDSIKNKITELQSNSFEHGYDIEQYRFKDKFKNHELTSWIASPLSQSTHILTLFYQGIHSESLDKNGLCNLTIRYMGGFPLEARILAYHLKARIIYNKASTATENDIKESIKLYIKAIEESIVYIGGREQTFPHLGLMYHELKKILENKTDEKIRKALKNLEKEDNAYKVGGKLSRYLNKDYCNSRATSLLEKMVNRHTQSQIFSEYVERRQYLHDSFSDPYVNILWTVDYILKKINQ